MRSESDVTQERADDGRCIIPLDPHTDTDTSCRAAGGARIVVLGTSMSTRDLGQGQR